MQSSTSNKRSQFRLTGPQHAADMRVTPIRGDLADISLAGSYFAPHYAKPKIVRCVSPMAMILSTPNQEAVSQINYGEKFAILDISGGYAWGYTLHDKYVGYVKSDALQNDQHDNDQSATHQISSRSALIFAQASIKSAIAMRIPMGAILHATKCDHDGFMAVSNGFIHKRHITPIGKAVTDSASLAAELIGAPYLWGGRNGDALDCSGLVQLVLGLQGIDAPRDSDMQQILGDEIAEGVPLIRGDIIFFPGHVGIMSDDKNIIHANAHWMQVKEEPLADVVARIEDGGVTARRRL